MSLVTSAATRLGHDGFDDASVDVGQAEVAAIVAIGQFFVVETEEPQNRGVQIMDVDLVLDSASAKFVRRTISHSAFHSATRHPHAASAAIVIAARCATRHAV